MNIKGLEDLKEPISVATSGGADSLALTHLLCYGTNVPVHVLTVDHGLRAQSSAEAAYVVDLVKEWPNAIVKTLIWSGEKPTTRILEAARHARYHLLSEYCKAQGVKRLYLGHHGDDQAETLLTRLAKGSGVDGLVAMRENQPYDHQLTMIRPLLKFRHEDCIAYCQAHNLVWVEDPSNHNQAYLRPRLRAAQNVLGKEGLTVPRLMRTCERLYEASLTLEWAQDQLWDQALVSHTSDQFIFRVDAFRPAPPDLVTRVIRKAMRTLSPNRTYDPRLERVEALVYDFMVSWDMKGRTLGGCHIAVRQRDQTLVISRE